MEEAIKGFPKNPGLYIAQRGCDVVLVKIVGIYPTLNIGKMYDLSTLIEGNSVKEVEKCTYDNFALFPEKWTITPLNGINMRVFPKLNFKADGYLDLTTEERTLVRNKCFRMLQSGISTSKIVNALVYEYKVSLKTAVDIFNEYISFDYDNVI